MTLNEFRAWLDGFSAAMGDAPTPQQWATVLEKLATVEAFPNIPARDWGIGPQKWDRASQPVGMNIQYASPNTNWPIVFDPYTTC